MVDEWGAWYEVEPGTNPGFLFQQNTLRDALIAGINLNIFNNHCDRVKMSNIAQVINVLQAMIFTKEEKMVLTPTFYVFEMYKVHHDAALIPLQFESPLYTLEDRKIPAISASASKDKKGIVHITFTNVDPKIEQTLNVLLAGVKASSITGRVITAKELNSCNTFEKPETLKSEDFKDFKINKENLTIKLPAKSVVMVELK
jgi:alpha-N-arabinofuranosidase